MLPAPAPLHAPILNAAVPQVPVVPVAGPITYEAVGAYTLRAAAVARLIPATTQSEVGAAVLDAHRVEHAVLAAEGAPNVPGNDID